MMVLGKIKKRVQHLRAYWAIRRSGLFDSEYYLLNNADVANSGMDPMMHYVRHGWLEFRNPNKKFNTKQYLEMYPDAAKSDLDPLYHFILNNHDKKEVLRDQSQHDNHADQNSWIKNASDSTGFNQLIKDSVELLDLQADSFSEELIFRPENDVTVFDVNSDTIQGVDFITCDIWDTVLHRKCLPDEIKYQSARFLLLTVFYHIRPAFRNILSLYKARIHCENKVSMTSDYEYRYLEAIPRWLKTVLVDDVEPTIFLSLKRRLADHEFKSEHRSIEVNPEALNFLQKHTHIPKIFLSDFYMGAEFVSRLLQEKSIDQHFMAGYSSSDLALNKRSGTMYDYIVEQLETQPDKILHVGDNRQADYDIPRKKGFKAYHYVNLPQDEIKQHLEKAFHPLLQGSSSIHEKRIREISCLSEKKKSDSSSTFEGPLYRLGRQLAPMAVGYVLSIIEEAKRYGVETVYFFTREGYFLKYLYDTVTSLDPYLTDYPQSRLLEVSRLAVFSASLRNTSINEMMRIWNQYSSQSPQSFCASLKLNKADCEKIFQKEGVDFEKDIQYPWKDKKFLKLFSSRSFQEILSEHIKNEKELICGYLSQLGFGQGEVCKLIVDIGWRGTIQDSLSYITNDQHIHGCYLGLLQFLNTQPENSSKTGWLFDVNNNTEKRSWIPSHVAPLEMLFSSAGGSVSGYEKVNGSIAAQKVVIRDEEQVYVNDIAQVQQGILDSTPGLCDYLGRHGLLSGDIRGLGQSIAKSLLQNPPSCFAKAFFQLEHNETFGTGSTHNQMKSIENAKDFKKHHGSQLHYYSTQFLKGHPWIEGIVKLPEIQSIFNSMESQQRLHLASRMFLPLKNMHQNKCIKIGFFVPPPLIGSGGHRTFYNIAQKLYESGCEIYIFLEDKGAGVDVVRDYLQGAPAHIILGWHKHYELDAAVATIAHSVQFVSDLKTPKHKFSFIQDFEALFNPMGDAYHIAEQSYIYPMTNLTVGNWLSHLLKARYQVDALPAGLGADTRIYHPTQEVKKEKAICFLYQPDKPRRCPNLAIEALRIVKSKHPDLKIYVYGSDMDINLDFKVKNMGLVRDLKKLNQLYNKCMIGLCISMSNPSRIPFEQMAAGLVPVDVYRYNNLMDYPNGTVSLAYQGKHSIAKAISLLLEDSQEYKLRRQKCIEFATSRTLEWEQEVIVNIVMEKMSNGKTVGSVPKIQYTDAPVVDAQDRFSSVKAFCDYQRSLAFFQMDKTAHAGSLHDEAPKTAIRNIVNSASG